jgi:hypothetical protein
MNPGNRWGSTKSMVLLLEYGEERTLSVWESPRKLQEKFGRRLYEISSLVDPDKARFASFLGQFTTEEMLTITLRLATAESASLKPLAAVFFQEDRKMVATGRETAEGSDQYVAIPALSGALSWVGCTAFGEELPGK